MVWCGMVWVRPFYKLLLYRISCCTCSQGLTGGKSPSAPSPPFFFLLSWSRRQTLKLISRSAAECPLVQSLVSCGSSHYSSNQFPKQLSSWPIGKPLNLAIQGISIPKFEWQIEYYFGFRNSFTSSVNRFRCDCVCIWEITRDSEIELRGNRNRRGPKRQKAWSKVTVTK